jgi:hypothetical protein
MKILAAASVLALLLSTHAYAADDVILRCQDVALMEQVLEHHEQAAILTCEFARNACLHGSVDTCPHAVKMCRAAEGLAKTTEENVVIAYEVCS